MKGRRVLRGQCLAFNYEGAKHLIVDDGNPNDAWRITRFEISPYDLTNAGAGGYDCVAVLATSADAVEGPLSSIIGWNWEDRRQVAWSSCLMSGDTGVYHTGRGGIIDPQHVVVRDLFFALSAFNATGTTRFNYFIELERVELNDHQSVMALIQEEGQGV